MVGAGRDFDVVVLLGEAVADCQTPYDCGLKVALGCRWWRCVIGKCREGVGLKGNVGWMCAAGAGRSRGVFVSWLHWFRRLMS